MRPEEVPDELVEAAVPEALALFKVCALDSTEQPDGACVYCRDDAEALVRAALAAVLPDYGVAVLEAAIAHRVSIPDATGYRVDAVFVEDLQDQADFLRAKRAARLTATTEEPTP